MSVDISRAPAGALTAILGNAEDRFITDVKLSKFNNNLNAVRLVLATAVIYSHSFYPLHDTDSLKPLLGWPISWFAVDGFFALSGFLVYRSLENRNSITDYAVARLSRIWPGLMVMALVVAFAGMLVSTLPAAAYVANPKLLAFILGNASIIHPVYELPGVNCGPIACNVNGSLWTIPWEIFCYIGLAAMYFLARVTGGPKLVLAAVSVSFAAALLANVPTIHQLLASKLGSKIYFIDQPLRLWVAFGLGIAAYVCRRRLYLSWPIAVAIFVGAVAAQHTPFAVQARAIAAAYIVLCAGFRTGNGSATWGDYSFGMYIYGMPVLTAFIILGVTLPPLALTVAVAACTFVFAYLSWELVERRALEFPKYLRGKRVLRHVHAPENPPVHQIGGIASPRKHSGASTSPRGESEAAEEVA